MHNNKLVRMRKSKRIQTVFLRCALIRKNALQIKTVRFNASQIQNEAFKCVQNKKNAF